MGKASRMELAKLWALVRGAKSGNFAIEGGAWDGVAIDRAINVYLFGGDLSETPLPFSSSVDALLPKIPPTHRLFRLGQELNATWVCELQPRRHWNPPNIIAARHVTAALALLVALIELEDLLNANQGD